MAVRGERLVLFAREPRAGRVKTRLAAGVGDEAAVRLYAAFLCDLARELAPRGEWDAVVAHAEREPGPALARTFADGWTFAPQGEGGLGERLTRAFERAAAERTPAVVAGSDAPTLSRADVGRAFAALRSGADVVQAPSPAGGYALVGLRPGADPASVFREVRWSSEHALGDTRANAGAAGLVTAIIEGVPDVDTAEDLAALRTLLVNSATVAPATRRVIEEVS